MSSEAEQAKARGSDAYKASRFSDAIKEFSSAIDSATEDDTGLLHLLYSNRSAAYQQLKQFDKGYEDAEACTLTKPNWPKGFVHLGYCATKLGRFDAAITAYKKAMELDPSRATSIQQSLSVAEQGKRQQVSNSAARNAGLGSHANFAASLPASVGKLILWFGMFLNAFAVLFPFPSSREAARSASRAFVISFLASSALDFYSRHGFPKMTQEFLVQVMSDRRVQRVMGGMLLLMGPNTLILLSLLVPEFAALCACLVGVLRHAPIVGSRASAALQALLADKILDRSGAPFWKVDQWSSYLEVGALVMLLVGLALPTRNIGQLVLWAQNLQVRFVIEKASGQTSGVLHVAFALLESRCDALAARLPGALGAVYKKAKGLVKRQVALPDANAPKAGFLSGLTSKCTIM